MSQLVEFLLGLSVAISVWFSPLSYKGVFMSVGEVLRQEGLVEVRCMPVAVTHGWFLVSGQ